MKRKVLQGLMKKTMAGTLAVGMMMSGICLLPTTVSQVYATEATQSTSHAEQLDISKYQTTAPKPTGAGYEEWVFAGWYEEEACTTPITTKPENGKCWAKFVPAEVLSVKCQMLSGTTKDTASSKLRLVSTVDSLNYNSVGFEIKIGEKNAFSYKTSTVVKEIKAAEDGVAFGYTPSDLCGASKYFTTVTLTSIPASGYATGIYITPYWETLDGTKVYGVSRFARVEDGYLNVVNVPVRLYADTEVAAGLLTVGYDKDIFEYKGIDTGVFEEMEVADDKDGTIRCVGNVADITENAQADGLYANLRFTVKDNQSIPTEGAKFIVSDEDFCNNAEQVVTLEVADVVYKVLSQKLE